MRIAQIAPAWFPVPPSGYGGIELVVALLADRLVEAGHDVTLFASGGSTTKAELVTPLSQPPDPAMLGNPWYDAFHATSSYLQVHDFDVVHDHAAIVGPACAAMLRGRPPVVHTIHGPWTEDTRLFYSAIDDIVHLVAISEAQRRDNTHVRYAATVHNGIDMDAYEFRDHDEKEDYLVYVGRANPDKGPSVAINVAGRAGMPLKMILKRSEPGERAYFDDAIAPLVTDDVELFENVTHAEKVELLGRARAMIFPIRWPEPFGLVMVEAMACGTPVVTTNWGAAPEVVEDGVTGYRRDDYGELVSALTLVDQLAPAACRARVEAQFSASAMVRKYEVLYERVVAGGVEGFSLPA